jgi:glycosyltransferase involved in cell wall biosynthesis
LKRVFDKVVGRKILREAEFLIAETQVGVEEYLAVDPLLDKDKIVIISPPFDTDEFEKRPDVGKFREKYKVDSDKKVIMFLGRVHHIKGNDFLIEGFAALCESRSDCLLMIVGSDDGHMDECKSLAKSCGVEDKVIFTGFIGGADKNEALVDADIVVQMSRQEQGAWAPFEAVLCGTPIIVSEDTGAGEDVKRVNAGETVKFGDIDALSKTINLTLENYNSALEKTELAKNFIMTKMSMNSRSQEYIDVYNQAISNKKASNR